MKIYFLPDFLPHWAAALRMCQIQGFVTTPEQGLDALISNGYTVTLQQVKEAWLTARFATQKVFYQRLSTASLLN